MIRALCQDHLGGIIQSIALDPGDAVPEFLRRIPGLARMAVVSGMAAIRVTDTGCTYVLIVCDALQRHRGPGAAPLHETGFGDPTPGLVRLLPTGATSRWPRSAWSENIQAASEEPRMRDHVSRRWMRTTSVFDSTAPHRMRRPIADHRPRAAVLGLLPVEHEHHNRCMGKLICGAGAPEFETGAVPRILTTLLTRHQVQV